MRRSPDTHQTPSHSHPRPRRRLAGLAAAAVALAAATSLASGPALAAPGAAPVPASAPSAGPAEGACTLAPSGHSPRDEARSCLQVTTTLSRAPEVGSRANLQITVRSAVAFASVRVEADLPAGLRWVKAPAGMAVTERSSAVPVHLGRLRQASTTEEVDAEENLRYFGVVEAIAAGPAEITVRAVADASRSTGSAADSAFVTIGKTAAQSSLGIATDHRAVAAATAATGVPMKAVTSTTRTKLAALADWNGITVGRAGPPARAAVAGVAASPGGTVCAKGNWRFLDRNGTARPALGWVAQLWDDNPAGDTLLTTAFVGWSGEYNLCANNGDSDGTGRDLYVQFVADAYDWRVVQTGIAPYHFWTSTSANVRDGVTVSYGTLQPPAMYMRSATAFDAVFSAWQTIPACWDEVNACRAIVILWTPDSTDGTYYSPSTNDIHLKAADPDSPFVVVHEASHSIMDDVYQDNMPSTPNCNPHSVRGASSTGCAWVEGFAEWFPAEVFDEPVWRTTTTLINLETPTATSANWADGDTVEGRVAGALIDLSDSTNEGTDRVSEGMGNIWRTFQLHNSTTFARFWADRRADGFTVGNNALGSLFQNSIDYGYTP